MNPAERTEKLALLVVLFVVSVVIVGHGVLNKLVDWPEWVRLIADLVVSAILLELFIKVCYSSINASSFFARLYWGSERYLRGYWHYTSELDGKKYVGVWKFEQTALKCTLFAYGVREDFERRFISHSVGSISEVGGESGLYEVVLSRRDYDENETKMFTLNRFRLGDPERIRWYLKAPRRIYGDTFTVGGEFTGKVNRNVEAVRHPDVDSDEKMMERLRQINPFN